MLRSKRGFTLIELMIVVAIIGILAAIAIPKFSQLITKGNEANTKGNLGAIRSALSIYYGDLEGWYPVNADLTALTLGQKYMTTIPMAKLPTVAAQNAGHGDSNDVTETTVLTTDSGGWAYNNDRTTGDWGRILVGCSHRDTRGTSWTTY